MKMEILERKKNPLMKREEVRLSVEHGGKATPSRANLLKEVAGKIKAKPDLLIIDSIFTSKGNPCSDIRVLVYKKNDDIPKGKLEKMKTRMEKKGEKPAEEPKPAEKKEPEKGGEEAETVEERPEEKGEEAKPEDEKEGIVEEAKG